MVLHPPGMSKDDIKDQVGIEEKMMWCYLFTFGRFTVAFKPYQRKKNYVVQLKFLSNIISVSIPHTSGI